MKLLIVWERPIPIRKKSASKLSYSIDVTRIPTSPGIYIFARRWGRTYEALYVGKSNSLRKRISTHLKNNLQLVRHIDNASSGKRVIIVGLPSTKPGQQMPNVLRTLEMAVIRHFLSEQHDLVNKQGTRILRNEIMSSGAVPKAFIPAKLFVKKT